MWCLTGRASPAAITFLVVVFMVCLATYTTQGPGLALSGANNREMPHNFLEEEAGVQVLKNSSSPSKPTSMPDLRPYTVTKNVVYYQSAKPPSLPKNKKRKRGANLEPSEAAALQHLNYLHYEPEERQYLESRVGVMVDRAKQVKRACRNAPPSGNRFPQVIWDQVHGVVWCPNYKVASTTWMINFLKMTNFNNDNPDIPSYLPEEERNKLKYSRKFGAKQTEVWRQYPSPATLREKKAVLKNSSRVIIVRHPFTRLLSAYRDKMLKIHPQPVSNGFLKIQKKIIKKYRPANPNDTFPFPTFPEFVQYVIDMSAYYTTGEQWRENVICWIPFWAQCDVCSMDYNVIMKLETMTDDEKFLITLSNMKKLKKIEGEWRNLRNVTSTQAAPDFYRQLTTRQMLDLHQRYKLDFELFGYTLDAYLPLAKDAPNRPHS